MDKLPLSLQIAITRARMVAKRCAVRAVDILRSAGVPFAQAVRFVAVQRAGV